MRSIRLWAVLLAFTFVTVTSAGAFAAAIQQPSANRVTPQADLIVDSISQSNPIKEGDKIGAQSIFNIIAKNTGNAASADCKVKIAVVALSGGPAPVELTGTMPCRALAPGGSMGFAWPNLSSATWAPGQYRMTVEVDSDKVITEANERNNFKIFDFIVTAKLAGAIGLKTSTEKKVALPDMLKVTTPSNGAMWCINTTEKITWQNNSNLKTGSARILLLKDDKVFRSLNETVSFVKGEYAWTIASDIPEGNYRIRVISNADEDIRGTSGEFKLYKLMAGAANAAAGNKNQGSGGENSSSVALTSPLGGESYKAGQYLPVTWTFTGDPNRFVTITLEKKGGGSLEITDKAVLKAGKIEYGGNIPFDQKYNGQFKVKLKINGTNHTDISADYFAISVPAAAKPINVTVTSPAGGESWKVGESRSFSWKYDGDTTGKMINIELMHESGKYAGELMPGGMLASGQQEDKFTWQIPTNISPGRYYINVYITNSPMATSGVFTIKGIKDDPPATTAQKPGTTPSAAGIAGAGIPVTVTAPTGGERWELGSARTIAWTNQSAKTGTAKIALMQGDTMVGILKTSAPFDKGANSAEWLIDTGKYQPGTYRIRVVSNSDGSIQGTSGDFALEHKTSITLIAPHNGTYLASQEMPIDWTFTGSSDRLVKITLEKEGGGSRLIKDAVHIGAGGQGGYSWTVPGEDKSYAWQYNGKWKVKVQIKDTQIVSLSENYLTINTFEKPEIKLISPTAGATWKAGDTRTIIFGHKGNVGSVVNVHLLKGGDLVKSWQIEAYFLDSSGQTAITYLVPPDISYGNDYEIKVSGSTPDTDKAVSSGKFTIIGAIVIQKNSGNP